MYKTKIIYFCYNLNGFTYWINCNYEQTSNTTTVMLLPQLIHTSDLNKLLVINNENENRNKNSKKIDNTKIINEKSKETNHKNNIHQHSKINNTNFDDYFSNEGFKVEYNGKTITDDVIIKICT